jgi:hypothetical protein
MKSEVLSYVIATIIMIAVMGLGLGISFNLEAVTVLLSWATAGGLLAMALMEYRKPLKRLIGRA